MGRRLVPALLGLSWLTACAMPDWADPIEIISGPTPAPTRVTVEPVDQDSPFPSLGSVPDLVERPSPQRVRDRRTRALSADRGEARTARPGPAPRPEAPAAAPFPGPDGDALPLVAPPGPEPGAVARAGASQPPDWATRGELVAVLYFPAGATEPAAGDRRILREVASLQRRRGGRLVVVGHASRRPKSANPIVHRVRSFELSLGRATRIARVMAELGVRPEDVSVVAAADSAPVYDESEPTGEAGNRRIEIFLE